MNNAASRPFVSFLAPSRAWLPALVQVGSAACLLAVASQCSMPWPGSVVPLSAQPQAVLWVAAALGRTRGPMAVAAWLAMAVAGWPVLAQGANGVALLGPTAGYLWSYLPVAWLVGAYGRQTGLRGWLVWQLAGAGILAGGAAGLSLLVGPKAAVAFGVAPFWWPDAVKMTAAFLLFAAAGRPLSWLRARR